MQQQTFAEVTFEQYRKPTRRERFLDEMNRVVPWSNLVAAIEPVIRRQRIVAVIHISRAVIFAAARFGRSDNTNTTRA